MSPYKDETTGREAPGSFVGIVEDEASVRQVLCDYLASIGYAVRSFDSAEAMLARIAECSAASCMVLDVKMTGMDGISLLGVLRKKLPSLPVIIMTGHGDIPMAVKALHAGASNFLEKPFNPDQFEAALSAAIASRNRAGAIESEAREASKRLGRLTARQLEILVEIAKGKTSKEIGLELGLSYRTVETHRAWILARLEASSLAELVRLVVISDLERALAAGAFAADRDNAQ